MPKLTTESPQQNSDQPSTASTGWRAKPGAVQWLLVLALLYTVYFTSTLLMPIVVALLVALLLSPLVALFKRYRIPRPVSALLLMTMLGGPFVLVAVELAAPVQKWAERVPELASQLTKELDEFEESLAPAPQPAPATEIAKPLPPPPKETGFNWFGWFDEDDAPAPQPVPAETVAEKPTESALVVSVKESGVEILFSVLGATPVIIAQLVIWLILVLFILIFGPGLYENFINHSPLVTDRRRAEVLVGRVRQELSRYIVTVSMINVGLGTVTAFVLWYLDIEDALLWGALVGLLNFAPYVGPVIAVAILCVAGLVQFGVTNAALIPPAAYFTVNLIESQFITPTILGRHMRLNPLVLVLWILLWGWLWGAIGVLLAVPLLVCIKLVARQLGILSSWIALIETQD